MPESKSLPWRKSFVLLTRFSQLCRYMLNLIDSSGVLQLRIELARDGMKLNPDAVLEHRDDALSVRRLIDRAEDRRNALRYPVPRLQRVLDCPHTGRYPFEVSLISSFLSLRVCLPYSLCPRFAMGSGAEPITRLETTFTSSDTTS